MHRLLPKEYQLLGWHIRQRFRVGAGRESGAGAEEGGGGAGFAAWPPPLSDAGSLTDQDMSRSQAWLGNRRCLVGVILGYPLPVRLRVKAITKNPCGTLGEYP